MAAITINNIDEFIAFSNGDYGRGTSDEYLEVELTADIDFATDNDGEYKLLNWAGCTGTWYIYFDGGGHTISNISVNKKSEWGFFFEVYGSIKDLVLEDVDVVSTANVGVVACRPSSTQFTNIKVSGYVSTTATVGVFADRNNMYTIDKCGFSGTLISGGVNYGLGYGYSASQICNSYVIGTLKGSDVYAIGVSGAVSKSFFVGKVYFTGTFKALTRTGAYCYVAVDNAEDLVDYTNSSFFNTTDNTMKCWFDNTTWKNGEEVDENGVGIFGTPFLKNGEWLREQGWDI